MIIIFYIPAIRWMIFQLENSYCIEHQYELKVSAMIYSYNVPYNYIHEHSNVPLKTYSFR